MAEKTLWLIQNSVRTVGAGGQREGEQRLSRISLVSFQPASQGLVNAGISEAGGEWWHKKGGSEKKTERERRNKCRHRIPNRGPWKSPAERGASCCPQPPYPHHLWSHSPGNDKCAVCFSVQTNKKKKIPDGRKLNLIKQTHGGRQAARTDPSRKSHWREMNTRAIAGPTIYLLLMARRTTALKKRHAQWQRGERSLSDGWGACELRKRLISQSPTFSRLATDTDCPSETTSVEAWATKR